MEWCRREWDAGLGLLSDRYGFKVRPYDDRPPREISLRRPPGEDYSDAPAALHAISFKSRTLWLTSGNDPHGEWLHEAAHLVCCPPWEKGPNDAGELAAIFGWERAVAKHFTRIGLWTKEDLHDFFTMQDIYGVGKTPDCWGLEGRDGEWSVVKPGYQRMLLAYMNRTLRRCGLLNIHNRPTFEKPDWKAVGLKHRWEVTSDFRIHWGDILADLR